MDTSACQLFRVVAIRKLRGDFSKVRSQCSSVSDVRDTTMLLFSLMVAVSIADRTVGKLTESRRVVFCTKGG